MSPATGTSPSPPTERVLDVVSLLARRDGQGTRLTDVIDELHITAATAHAILSTLCARGWASRDTDKTYSVGPELGIVAARAASARPLTTAARRAAAEFAMMTGDSASVTERLGDSIVITTYEPGADQPTLSRPGDRVPFAAPFGPGFAAFEPEEIQQAWMQRSGVTDAAVSAHLHAQLEATRRRGFTVERLTPAVARATQLIGTLHGDALPVSLRQIIDAVLVEITTVGALSDDALAAGNQPVTAMSAPLFDDAGRVLLNLAVHPFRPLTTKQIGALGKRLVQATAKITHG